MNPRLPLSALTALAACSLQAQAIIDRYLDAAVTYTDIVTSAQQVSQPQDLDFKPHTNELWVMNRGSGGGSHVIVHNAGLPGQTSEYRRDSHSGHFFVNPSAMAFSENGEWANSNEIQSTNGGNSTFMGPALWEGDLDLYAVVFQNNWVSGYPLGSHTDMLHQSPFSMGIASDSAKVYWVMDGHNGNIVRYDFVADHGPGYDDHSAGKIWRYSDVTVGRVANMPSHLVVDHDSRWLYFIDGAAKQIKRLDMRTGTEAGNMTPPSTGSEPLASYKRVQGATVEVVDTWTTQPCGIDVKEGRLIVSDNTNGNIKIYDVTEAPALIGTISTGAAGIMGVKIGPDGRIWFVNKTQNKVVRIDVPALDNDAAVRTIVSPATRTTSSAFFNTAYNVCGPAIAPVVRLANEGALALTSVTIHYEMEGGEQASFDWTGDLAPGATEEVTLPNMNAANGAQVLSVRTENPNGTADQNNLNDQVKGAFRVVDPLQGLPYFQGFQDAEFPPADMNIVHFNPNNRFTRHATAGGFGASAGCLKMDNYSGEMNITGQQDNLMLPRLDLSGAAEGTELLFNVAYRRYNSTSADRLQVRASIDCGNTWNTLYDKQGAELATVTGNQTSAFTASATQWRSETVGLASVLGQPDVLFMFTAISGYGNNVYIDDISVGMSVGMAEMASAAVQVYPVPSTGLVTLISSAQAPVRGVEVLDLGGQRVHAAAWPTSTSLTMDLGHLAKGAYVLRTIGTDGSVARARIVLQ